MSDSALGHSCKRGNLGMRAGKRANQWGQQRHFLMSEECPRNQYLLDIAHKVESHWKCILGPKKEEVYAVTCAASGGTSFSGEKKKLSSLHALGTVALVANRGIISGAQNAVHSYFLQCRQNPGWQMDCILPHLKWSEKA